MHIYDWVLFSTILDILFELFNLRYTLGQEKYLVEGVNESSNWTYLGFYEIMNTLHVKRTKKVENNV